VQRVRVAAMRHIAGFASPSSGMRELLALHAARVFGRASLRFPRRLIDIRYCMAAAERPAKWLRLLRGSEIVEIFCHPGTVLADREKPGSCWRAGELEFLLCAHMRELLATRDLQLVNYWSV
jgi:predicted glycoside hydrolase/deacetylase ChbG (UPF0249 family)